MSRAWEPELADVLHSLIDKQDELVSQLKRLESTIARLKSEGVEKSGEIASENNSGSKGCMASCMKSSSSHWKALVMFFSGEWLDLSSNSRDVVFKNQVVQESQNLSIISALMLNLFVPIIFQVNLYIPVLRCECWGY